MIEFFKDPRIFRICSLLLAIILIGLSLFNFYEFAKSPTDENLFTNIPSNLMVVRNLPPLQQEQEPGVEKGDLLFELNGKRVETIVETMELLRSIHQDSLVLIEVMRPRLNKSLQVSILRKSIPDSFIQEIPPAVRVILVLKDGASDRAGMQTGDLIYQIDGQGFQNSLEADFIMRQAQHDKSIDYNIFRQDEPQILHVKMAIAGFRSSRILLLICGIVYIILGLLLAWFRPQYKGARMLGITGMLMGYFFAIVFNTAFIYWTFQGGIRFLLIYSSLFIGTTLWFNAAYYFPIEIESVPKLRQRKRIFNLMTVFFILSTFFLTAIHFLDIWPNVSGFLQNKSPAIFIIILFIYGIYSTIRTRKIVSSEYREMNRIVMYTGLATGVLSIVIFVLISLNIIDSGFVGLLLLGMPAAYMYTIGKYSLMDIKIRVRRNIQYSLISSSWILLVVLLSGYLVLLISSKMTQFPHIRLSTNFIEVTDETVSEQQSRTQDRMLFMVVSGGLLLSAWFLGRTGQRFLRTKYDRFRYDYRLAANEMSRVFNSNLDMYDLAREIASKLAMLMHLKRTGVLFFRDQAQCCCQEFYGFDGTAWTEYCLNAQDDIIKAIRPFASPVEIRKLPENLKNEFEKQEFKHLVPIRSKEQLVGLIFVGEKMAESAFQRDDYEFLSAVAGQASVSIENAFLYEQLREQERLKQELKIARHIQISSLPQKTPKIAGLDIHAISQPASEVGGDFYDYLNGSNDELMVVVGDVSGKGTSAALYMSKIQGIFRSLHTFNLAPRELFLRANQILFADLEKSFFVTGLGLKFFPAQKKTIVARAGHLPLLHYQSKRQSVSLIQSGGLGFGLENSDIFKNNLEEFCFTYQKGDIFLLATDGITETFNSSYEEFGEIRLMEALKETADQSARKICDYIMDQLEKYRGETDPHDDSTMVVIKVID
ncbi:MAG: SpoIIE family protein phosphatase [Calditrichae bacterium]|nr:SpoIIE family protein phosphatase [Calditrichia bacterium]